MGRHIRKGDQVIVNSGKFRHQTGEVIEVLVERQRVRVKGIAEQTCNLKPGKNAKYPDGGKIKKLGSLHMSNVQPIDPISGKATRVQFKKLDDGRKVRIAQRSGQQLGKL